MIKIANAISEIDDDAVICITGVAGFIGFHLARTLLEAGKTIVGIDNFSDYYDVNLKRKRMMILAKLPDFTLLEGDITTPLIHEVFARYKPKYVVNLAAQAGVRYSLKNPGAYIHTNISGFTNVLEACRHFAIDHLVYASSSSVYGANQDFPFSEKRGVNHPVSLYAATKKSNEMLAHSYSHMFGLHTTGLRFFTVYGPWGRPDMALFLFAEAIYNNKPIDIFNHGKMRRDFTYIDDIVDGIIRLIPLQALPNPDWDSKNPDPSSSKAPYRIYNIGRGHAEPLLRLVEILEQAIGKKATKIMKDLQDGDVPETFADISALAEKTGFSPQTSIDVGIPKFVAWYKEYRNL